MGLFVLIIFALRRFFRLRNRQRQTSQLSSTRNTYTPCQSRFVAGAIFALIEARSAIWSSSVAFSLSILTCKTIGCGPSCGPSATFARRCWRGYCFFGDSCGLFNLCLCGRHDGVWTMTSLHNVGCSRGHCFSDWLGGKGVACPKGELNVRRSLLEPKVRVCIVQHWVGVEEGWNDSSARDKVSRYRGNRGS